MPTIVEKPQIFPATYKKQVFCLLEMRLYKRGATQGQAEVGGPERLSYKEQPKRPHQVAADIVTSSANISPAVSYDSYFSYY